MPRFPATNTSCGFSPQGYPSLWMVLGKDCFLNLCEKSLLISTQKEAIRHPRDVIADHAVNGPVFQRLQVVFRQFLRMSSVEFEQLRDHCSRASALFHHHLGKIDGVVKKLLELAIGGLGSRYERGQP